MLFGEDTGRLLADYVHTLTSITMSLMHISTCMCPQSSTDTAPCMTMVDLFMSCACSSCETLVASPEIATLKLPAQNLSQRPW